MPLDLFQRVVVSPCSVSTMWFGPGGPHFCTGAHLARLEIEIVFEEMIKRVAEFELAGEPERLQSNFFNGIKRMPVRLVAA